MIESWTQGFQPPAEEAAWLADARRGARARFAEVGFPTSKLEAWKYTSTKRIADVPYQHASDVDIDAAARLVGPARMREADVEVVFVAGRYAEGLWRVEDTEGVRVRRLSDAVGDEELREHLGRLADWQQPDRAFTALNTAFVQDGVVVQTARNSGPVRVHVIVVGQADDVPTVSHLRNVVVAGSGSQVTLIETFVAAGGEQVLTNLVDEVFVEPGAQVRHVATGLHPESAHLVHTIQARLDRDARYDAHLSWLGGGITRSNVDAVLAGRNSEIRLHGLYVLGGSSHCDNHTRIEHAVPHTTSRETYRGILGGRSKGVFDGLVVVQPDAQKTDAQQACHNLLVSEDADANAKPTLEIYADDVKCTHGTTVGQLDLEQLAYLRSRGIPRAQAERMLTAAFAATVVGMLDDEALRTRLDALVQNALRRVQEVP